MSKEKIITEEFLAELKSKYEYILQGLREKRETDTLISNEKKYLEYAEHPNVVKHELSPMELEYLVFLETTMKMNAVIQHMKDEETILSEKIPDYLETENGTLVLKKDFHPLLSVVFPQAGGMITSMENKEYPYKGFPYEEFVNKIDLVKKLSRGVLSGLYHQLKKRSRLSLGTLAFVPWLFKDLFRSALYTFYRAIYRLKIKPLLYSDAIRELYRAFSIPLPKENEAGAEFREQLKILFCMTFEFDNAYRFRIQDLLEELDKKSLGKNPRKELRRLCELIQSREKLQEVKDTWQLIHYFISYYLFFDRELLRIIAHILQNVDTDKTKLSVEDRYYCDGRKDYTFGYQLKEQKK